jgi:hypothetical protein
MAAPGNIYLIYKTLAVKFEIKKLIRLIASIFYESEEVFEKNTNYSGISGKIFDCIFCKAL